MLHLNLNNLEELKEMHFKAVLSHFNTQSSDVMDMVYADVIALPGFENYPRATRTGTEWLRDFILAPPTTLNIWVRTCPSLLKFTFFKKIYTTRFANGDRNYVDTSESYNAIALHKAMNIRVCPYCDDQYLYVVTKDGHERRTSEFDHFYPKADNEFPALAMCFYNLILSCKTCNSLKSTGRLGISPYEPDIESQSVFSHDIEVGVNMESVRLEDFELTLSACKGMTQNNTTLCLNDRYNEHKKEALDILTNAQMFDEEKIAEIARMFPQTDIPTLKERLMGPSYERNRLQVIHMKLKKDLIGQ